MNFWKKMIAVVLTIAMAACLLCACVGTEGGETNNTTEALQGEATYTVTIQDQNGNPVPSVICQFVDKDGTTQLAVTAADGKISHTSAVEITSVELTSIPDGYTASATTVSFEGKTELTVTLQAEQEQDTNVTYTVTIVDQNGNPVVGATIQLCDDENCKLPVVTDESGIAVCSYEQADYHVTITELPAGYSSDVTEFELNGESEITITVNAE